jgi:hypothetical protein
MCPSLRELKERVAATIIRPVRICRIDHRYGDLDGEISGKARRTRDCRGGEEGESYRKARGRRPRRDHGSSDPRSEVVSKMWAYIKKNDLQDAKDRRQINADDKLAKIFGKKSVSMFEMNKHLSRHLTAKKA